MEEDVKFIIRDLKASNYNKTLIKQLEHLLEAYKEDKAVIEEMAEYIGKDIRCIRPEIECNKMTHNCAKCVEECFRNKVKGEKE